MFWTLYNIYANCFVAEFNMLLKFVEAQKLKKERLGRPKGLIMHGHTYSGKKFA